jgi:hypothetical protein
MVLRATRLSGRLQIPAGACVLAPLRCSRTGSTLCSGARRKLRPQPGFAGGPTGIEEKAVRAEDRLFTYVNRCPRTDP